MIRTIAEAHIALEKARLAERENLKTPVETLRYQKLLLGTLRQLSTIKQDLSSAATELAALINAPPGTDLLLEIPVGLKVPTWNMTVEEMEETAFHNNPDLCEQGYFTRAILKLLPGITFTAERKNYYNFQAVDVL
ncbi:MAG: Outer membrane protein [Rhodospirillaceae bacterium]|nr:MAG: Outer membrane protein [Rhodospirillaceae bacterium]